MLIVAQKRSSAEEQNEPLPLTSQADFIARNHISLQQHHCFCGHGQKKNPQQPGRGGERREGGYRWGKWLWRRTGRRSAPGTWAWRWSCQWSRWPPPGRWGPWASTRCCWRVVSEMEWNLVEDTHTHTHTAEIQSSGIWIQYSKCFRNVIRSCCCRQEVQGSVLSFGLQLANV